MKKLKAIETKLVHWTMENPRQWRALSTVVFALSLGVQVHGFSTSDGWMRVASVMLGVMLVAIYIGLVFQWRRMDLLEELRLLVGEQTEDLRLLGNVAWFWAYQAPTKTVREIVVWLRTHNIARTPADDMPQPVRVLVNVLTLAL